MRRFAEKLVYRVAGLPLAVRALFSQRGVGENDVIRSAFTGAYWRSSAVGDWVRIGVAIFLWPIAFLFASLWFTARNGRAIRRREGRGIAAQVIDQCRLYFSFGVLPPWYYVFSLYRDHGHNVRTFLHRFETSFGVFSVLRAEASSPLNDKKEFANHCAAHQLRSVPYLAYLHDGTIEWVDGNQRLPAIDLFVKPTRGRGGRGAERWDRTPDGSYIGPDGDELGITDLLDRLSKRGRRRALLVQPRLALHPALAALSSGALSTARVVTCLDEDRVPEVVAAVFRMSIGRNRTIDNIHAGGIAGAINLETGSLGIASNLGFDDRLGWLTHHPDTAAQIEGTVLPMWSDVRRLATSAHNVFDDRVLIGWDIAITASGPLIIEGNSSPCVDLMQRPLRGRGLRNERFGRLLAHHLRDARSRDAFQGATGEVR